MVEFCGSTDNKIITSKKSLQKQQLLEGVYVSLSLREEREKTQDRNLETRTEAETTEEHRLLISFLCPIHSVFLKNLGHLPRVGTTHNRIGPSTAVIN